MIITTFFSSLKAFVAVSSSREPGVVLFKMFWKIKTFLNQKRKTILCCWIKPAQISSVIGFQVRTWILHKCLSVYLHQHFQPCDPLKREDQKRGERKSLTDGVLLQTSQDPGEARVLVPERTRRDTLMIFFSRGEGTFQRAFHPEKKMCSLLEKKHLQVKSCRCEIIS